MFGGNVVNIIVVGAGKVGKILTKHLSEENYDVTVIDINHTVVEEISNMYDVKAITGNGISYDVLKQANVATADVFISVTQSDEANILCCLFAIKMGAAHTIARVRGPEYLSQYDFFCQDLGISKIINPEYEAAIEIEKMLRYPSANHVDFFANGKAEIIEIILNESSRLIGKSLFEIKTAFNLKFLVSAVEREGEVHIPNGSFVLQENDKVCITGPINDIESLYRKLKIVKSRPKKIMVVGGSRIAHYLGKRLEDSNLDLKIIEMDEERCQELSRDLPKASIIMGDGTSQEILLEERIDEMDAVVTLTGFDEENIIISLFAKTLNVSKIITKINRYVYSSIFPAIDLGSIISPKMITSNLVVKFVRSLSDSIGHVRSLYKIINDQIEVAEFFIAKSSNYTDITFKELHFKPNVLVACIIRDGVVILPEGSDMMRVNDTVIILSNNQPLKTVQDALAK